jgi:hypothetical protein
MESSSNFLFNNHIYNSEGVTFFIGQFLDSDHSADGHRMYTSSGKLRNDVPFLPQVVHWIPPIKDRGTKLEKSL